MRYIITIFGRNKKQPLAMECLQGMSTTTHNRVMIDWHTPTLTVASIIVAAASWAHKIIHAWIMNITWWTDDTKIVISAVSAILGAIIAITVVVLNVVSIRNKWLEGKKLKKELEGK